MKKKSFNLSGVMQSKITWAVVAELLILLVCFIIRPDFFSIKYQPATGMLYGSLIDILNRSAEITIIAMGMTLVIALGGTDLSVGSLVALSGATGIAMHVLADTWAHRYFAGTPSLVINNTDSWFSELLPEGEGFRERRITFRHNPTAPDDLEKGIYTNSLFQASENAIMNLGHGRAGHLPDYSFIRYKYLPAWGDYEEVIKDNPRDYYMAFCQMIEAMKALRGSAPAFEKDRYDFEAAAPYEEEIRAILEKRQMDACDDWKAFGEKLSGQTVPDFDLQQYQKEYLDAAPEEKNGTFLGKYFLAALAQKSMVTNRISRSGSLLAGFSVELGKKGFRGMRDFRALLEQTRKGDGHD